MNTETSGRPREGLPAWVYAASVGLSLLAASAIVIRAVGSSSGRIRLGLTGEGVVSADEGDPVDASVAVDDDPADAPGPAGKGRGVTILASLTKEADNSARAAARDEPRSSAAEAIDRAKREIGECREKYRSIHDYSCVFHKRERIDGRLTAPHIMAMKVRTRPECLYFKFEQPNRGREAIYDPARNRGKILAHDVGIGKFLAGTMILDPRGSMAMEENRHPVTEAGIGSLIETVIDRWNVELDPSEAVVEIHPHARVAGRACTMIETVHTARRDGHFFHKVKVFIDRELGLPIRFEAYDWPKSPGAEPELIEEYTYADVKTDTGLTDADFDPANPRYSFGRF